MPLLLEEEQCRSLPEERRVLYILQWLQGLPPAIRTAPKEELKLKQKELVRQLYSQLQGSLGPPLRSCLARVFVALYEAGETFSMHETVGKCCDIVRSKDEGPSTNKLTAIECLGSIFQRHGRMVSLSTPSKRFLHNELGHDCLPLCSRLSVPVLRREPPFQRRFRSSQRQ